MEETNEVDLATLQRLAANPNYNMSSKQAEELERLRNNKYKRPSVLHKTGVQKHDTSIKNVHSPELEVENGRRKARRN